MACGKCFSHAEKRGPSLSQGFPMCRTVLVHPNRVSRIKFPSVTRQLQHALCNASWFTIAYLFAVKTKRYLARGGLRRAKYHHMGVHWTLIAMYSMTAVSGYDEVYP